MKTAERGAKSPKTTAGKNRRILSRTGFEKKRGARGNPTRKEEFLVVGRRKKGAGKKGCGDRTRGRHLP